MQKSFTLFIICLVSILAVNAQNNYKEVTLPELMNKLEKKDPNMIIVDVRTRGEYHDTSSTYQQTNIGHLKGAINIPLQDFRKDPATVHQLDGYKDKDIYVICSHSYRSRVVSNMLLDSGFTHVTNTRGGMTEFFRRYDELAPFANDFYETSIVYKNIAPAQLLKQLTGNKQPLLISVGNNPRFFWDSLNLFLNTYSPSFKNAVNYNYPDSLQILEFVKKENRPVVLFNTINLGAAELAKWLTQKGIHDVSYLVGSFSLFYEYLVDENLIPTAKEFIKSNSGINFITPAFYCDQIADVKNAKIIDVRHDTVFNKIINGAKYNFNHLKRAVNFYAGKGAGEFQNTFPDKKTEYIFISENGIDGLEFADDLSKKGYKIDYIIGGLHRWEWYMNNVETFKCMDYLGN